MAIGPGHVAGSSGIAGRAGDHTSGEFRPQTRRRRLPDLDVKVADKDALGDGSDDPEGSEDANTDDEQQRHQLDDTA